MFLFLIKRLSQAAVVMLVISVITFSIQSKLGDPTRLMTGQDVSKAERDKLREQLGLNDPFFVQYKRFLTKALHGDLGTSYTFNKPVLGIILEKLPATLELVFVSTLIIIFLSIPLGIYAAIHPHSFITKVIMGISIIGISVPVFLTAILLIFFFSVGLHWLPSFGRGDVVSVFGWHTGLLTIDGIKHIILPSIALSSIMLPLFIRLVRSEMVEALGEEYVKFAKAKGLSYRRIYYMHALKNTMLPVITVGGVQVGTMVAYTILTETVFSWPGTGALFLEAIHQVDVPLITGYLIFVGLIFVITNTIVDLLYGFINPTVRITSNN